MRYHHRLNIKASIREGFIAQPGGGADCQTVTASFKEDLKILMIHFSQIKCFVF